MLSDDGLRFGGEVEAVGSESGALIIEINEECLAALRELTDGFGVGFYDVVFFAVIAHLGRFGFFKRTR